MKVEQEMRQLILELFHEAEQAGARRIAICETMEVDLRRIERWEKDINGEDMRRGPTKAPANKLSEFEVAQILCVSNTIAYRDLSPWQIVAHLADKGEYLASASSFYRILGANKQLAHRSKSMPRKNNHPKELVATGPNQVWSWDITYLKSPITGQYFYLYMIMDVFSRMIVGWTVKETENADHASELMRRTCIKEGIQEGQIHLHSDNGGPMKGATMLATLQNLGVVPSFSRPSVSDDNPFSESLFRTLKYRPSFPDGAFADIENAREWVLRFVTWYNTEHLHSGIKFVTPQSRHQGGDIVVLEKRKTVYEMAKTKNPLRWSGKIKNWNRVNEVYLNPKEDGKTVREMLMSNVA